MKATLASVLVCLLAQLHCVVGKATPSINKPPTKVFDRDVGDRTSFNVPMGGTWTLEVTLQEAHTDAYGQDDADELFDKFKEDLAMAPNDGREVETVRPFGDYVAEVELNLEEGYLTLNDPPKENWQKAVEEFLEYLTDLDYPASYKANCIADGNTIAKLTFFFELPD